VEFEFLPQLPKSNLDDRNYKDLIDECLLRIPRYCPEWTNYNPSDPGITLVELFAWLTDQMLFRFNQVPRRNYITFLELLGIRLKAPEPSQTEVTFYLTRPQTAHERLNPIPAGTQIATEQMAGEAAVIFSIDRPLTIGVPRITHFLTAEKAHDRLDSAIEASRDQEHQLFRRGQINDEGHWLGRDQAVFRLQPEVGNCFYLVFAEDEPLDGNVLVLTIAGEPAGPTGIDPRRPPRRWEAWNGNQWCPILHNEADDGTLGFSFDEGEQGVFTAVQTAEVRLHLPIQWPTVSFEGYQGRWLRCVCTPTEAGQAGYRYSPLFSNISARSIGGSISASQCEIIQDELLGESNGKSGQVFELQSKGILPRDRAQEYIVLKPPLELQSLEADSLEEAWEERNDFADSTGSDRHYTLDSITGRIQFGPLIQEAAHLREEVAMRRQVQGLGYQPEIAQLDQLDLQEKQYGAVPPKGWTVRMRQYRTGGGSRGNVPIGSIKILKTAIPYVDQVINYKVATGGTDAESLDEAILHVPRMLRTANRAVTPEDFETLTIQASREVGRAFSPRLYPPNLPAEMRPAAGVVQVFVVPRVTDYRPTEGLAPERLQIQSNLREAVTGYLDQRRLLGVEVQLKTPNYVGVSVQLELSVAPEYRSLKAQSDLQSKLLERLYQFLNPLTGGADGSGWKFGEVLYRADIAALIQHIPGVRYLKFVELYAYEWRKDGLLDNGLWERSHRQDGVVDPGPFGLLCSWHDAQLRCGHIIRLSQEGHS
jgi:predicted phage baseplate assembly protein